MIFSDLSKSKRETFTKPKGLKTDKKYKVWWGRQTGSSGSTGIVRIKPKVAGMRLFIWIGGGGKVSITGVGWGTQAGAAGGASGVGIDSGYSSNIIVAPGGNAPLGGNTSSVPRTPAPSNAYLNTSTLDISLFDKIQLTAARQGIIGNVSYIYDSWHTLATAPAVSSYDSTTRGYGASAYNDYGQDGSGYPGIGGYVRITIV